VMRITVR